MANLMTLGHVFDFEKNFMLSSSLVSQQMPHAAVRKNGMHFTTVYAAASQAWDTALIETNRQYLAAISNGLRLLSAPFTRWIGVYICNYSSTRKKQSQINLYAPK